MLKSKTVQRVFRLCGTVGFFAFAGDASGAGGEVAPIVLASVAYSVSSVVPALAGGDVFDCGFEAESTEVCTFSQIQRIWRNASGGAPTWAEGVSNGRCSIVNDGAQGKALAVLYPAGGVGPAAGGAQWKFDFGRKLDSATVEYKVKFPVGVDFAKGGKLPGLCGGTAPSGGNPPNGTDGFSARIMWRRNSAGADSAHGYIGQYLYNVNQISIYGDDLWWASPLVQEAGKIGGYTSNWSLHKNKVKYFEPGEWHTVRTYVKVNDVGVNNAIVRSWLDDKLALDATNLTLRTVNTFGVDLFYFTTFYGGDTPDWAPLTTQTVLFDDFKIWNGEKPAPNRADLRLHIPAGAPPTGRVACLFGDMDGALTEVAAWPFSAGNAVLLHRMDGLRLGHPYSYAFEVYDSVGVLEFATTNSLLIYGTCTWTGAGADTDWFNPQNWDYGVPGQFASATLFDSANVTLNSAVKIRDLDMRGHVTLLLNLPSAPSVMIDASGDILMNDHLTMLIDTGDFSGNLELMRAGGMISPLSDTRILVSPRKGYYHRITQSASAMLFSRYRWPSVIMIQ